MSGPKGLLSEQLGKTTEHLPQGILRTFEKENQLFQVHFNSWHREIEYHSILSTFISFLIDVFYIRSVVYSLSAWEIYQSLFIN